MCHYMKSDDIIRINMFCNRVTNKEAIKYWGNDRTKYLYKNFPSKYIDYKYTNSKYTDCKYIENENPEVIFLIIENTKYFLLEYIKKEFELKIANISINNSINIINKNLLNDFIYYNNEYIYKVSYFFQLLIEDSNIPSNNFMRVTTEIELKPSCWIKNCIFELFEIEEGTIKFTESSNREKYVYKSDEYNINIVDTDIESNNTFIFKNYNTVRQHKKIRYKDKI